MSLCESHNCHGALRNYFLANSFSLAVFKIIEQMPDILGHCIEGKWKMQITTNLLLYVFCQTTMFCRAIMLIELFCNHAGFKRVFRSLKLFATKSYLRTASTQLSFVDNKLKLKPIFFDVSFLTDLWVKSKMNFKIIFQKIIESGSVEQLLLFCG